MDTKVTDFTEVAYTGGNIATKTIPLNVEQKDAKAQKTILAALQAAHKKVTDAAAGKIVFSPAWIVLEDAIPIFGKGTINMIQGRTGSHKSRLAEGLCSLLLSAGKGDFIGFSKNHIGTGYCVAYVDTERNCEEDFAASVQRIRRLAGYEPTAETRNLYPVSIKQIDREDRLKAVRTWIEYVRNKMEARKVPDWHLFVVLDVVTDCVRSFNNDADSLALFDYIGRLCEDYGVTFLLVMHENPGSEKARGHTGTEAMNKSNCQLQIGYERGSNGEDTELIKLRFMKTRNSARPAPIYLKYDPSINGLAVADPDEVREVLGDRSKRGDVDMIREFVERFFDDKDSSDQKTLVGAIVAEFQCSPNTAKTRLNEIAMSANGLHTKDGAPAKLIADVRPGKPTTYRLQTSEGTPPADALLINTIIGDDEEETPF